MPFNKTEDMPVADAPSSGTVTFFFLFFNVAYLIILMISSLIQKKIYYYNKLHLKCDTEYCVSKILNRTFVGLQNPNSLFLM